MSRPLRRTAVAGVVALLAVGLVTGSRGGPATAAPVTHQAENATIFHGVVESEHTGYTGTGYVNSTNEVGAYVEWTFTPATAGSVTLRFRYANGVATNRTTSVTLNGSSLPTLQFPSTGGWTSWEMQNLNASLRAGSNTVRATATTAGGLANLDSLVVDDGQGGGGPISDPIPENPIASGLGLTLTQFGAQFPQTNPVPTPTDSRLMRRARINYLGQIPGSSRLFVPDLNGRLYTLTSTGGTPSVYLDVRSRVGSNFFSGRGMGSGFGFVAFHPDFANNGRFYTTHSEAFDALGSITPEWTQSGADVHSVVTEWTATNPAAATFSGSRRTILRIGFASYLHAIQQIDFNPTAAPGSPDYGMLYIAVGDGGIGYQNSQPQNMNMVHGKLLRIDPRGTNGINGRYGIPPSNPFVGRPSTRGEIYAVGFRDPHRFSWDSAEGNRLFLGNIGEHDVESIYDLRAGDNAGWSVREGPFVFNQSDRCNLYRLPSDDERFGFTYPVAAYDHNPPPGWSCTRDVGRAVVGGFVYRGNALPALRGKYVFGDLVDGRVFYTNANEMIRGAGLARLYQLQIFNSAGTRVTMQSLAGDDRVDMRFGMDQAGELYIMAKANGRIWKVTGTRGSAP